MTDSATQVAALAALYSPKPISTRALVASVGAEFCAAESQKQHGPRAGGPLEIAMGTRRNVSMERSGLFKEPLPAIVHTRKENSTESRRNTIHDIGSTPHVLLGLVQKAAGDVIRLPPNLARRILDEMNFSGQRAIRQHRLVEHLRRIEAGTWIEGTCIIELVLMPDGTLCLVDGQHRLEAIARGSRPIGLKINIVAARDEGELRRIYNTHDQKSSIRSTYEVIDAAGVANELNLPRSHAKALFDALPVLNNDMDLPGRNVEKRQLYGTDTRIEEIANWAMEMCWYSDIVKTAQAHLQRKLLRVGCTAVAVYTLRHAGKKAKEFWAGLAGNDGLRRHDPRATLIADMGSRSLADGAQRQSIQQPVIAWNAFFENRDLRQLKCIEGADILIAGTPLAKRGAK